MPRDLSIAARCRNAGLRVVEVAGWQTRGNESFNPRGSVNHHTAGPARGTTPSLNGVIHGFAGSAPGPLAHALQSREVDGRDIFYIVAAGRANHAGLGGWRGLSGNTSVFGLEIEHTGRDPLSLHRQRLAATFHAAMAKGRWNEGMVCQHKEWAPTRKIDAATHVDPTVFRTMVRDALVIPTGDDDLTPAQAKTLDDCETLSRQARDLAHATRVEQGNLAKAEAVRDQAMADQLKAITAQIAAIAAKLDCDTVNAYEVGAPIVVALISGIALIVASRNGHKTQQVADRIGEPNGAGTVMDIVSKSLSLSSQIVSTQQAHAETQADNDRRLRNIEEKLEGL